MSALTSTTKIKGADPIRPAYRAGGQVPLVGGFVLLLALAAGSIWLFVSSRHYADTVSHTLTLRSKAYQLLTLIQDAETGQRGFLLTNNRNYLQPYLSGSAEAPKAASDLKLLAAGNQVQSASIGRVEKLMQGKLRELASTLVPAEQGDLAAALAIVRNDTGNNIMTTIREEIGEIEAEEDRAQTVLSRGEDFNNALLAGATLAAIVLIVALAGYVITAARRSTGALLEAQDDLRLNNENLEGLVAERVSELQVANEEIQRFAYIVSHDLRAPLVNVMGFTSELDAVRGDIASFLTDAEEAAPQLVTNERRAAIETDLPEALSFIRTSTAKMDRLINAILKLSREGRRVLTPQKIDVREMVEAQSKSLSQQLAAAEAEVEIGPDLPDVVSDRLAVEQIFGNLIENATKYLKPGRAGRIEVVGRTQGGYVRYEIKDNGRGIESKDFERIFELFRRSGEQDKPGEGIGLAYVRNLARRLGGNVSVQSEYGTGSTFIVVLPTDFQPKARAMR